MISTGIMSLPFISPSSPPPIDSDQIADIDEDFGHYVGQEDNFDITGLSQKLSTAERENDASLRTSSTLLENISNVCIQNTDIGTGNLNDFPVYSESLECTSAASESSLSLTTPPPFDCVDQQFLEGNSCGESLADQNHAGESDDEFGEFVIGPDNTDLPDAINCIEPIYKNNCNDKSQSCQNFSNDCQEENELIRSSETPVIVKDNLDNELKEYPEADNFLLNDTPNKDKLEIGNYNTTEAVGSEIAATSSINIINSSSEYKEAISCTSLSENESKASLEKLNDTISFNSHYPNFREFQINNSCEVTDCASANNVEFSANVLSEVGDSNTSTRTQCFSVSNENETNIGLYLEDDDNSEFGDFADFETCKNEPVIHDFDNDFADVSEEENSELEKELRNKIDLAINDDDDDDEFGAFNSNVSLCEDKSYSEKEPSWTQRDNEEIISLNNSKLNYKESFDDKLNQFDTFILKWVPLEPCFNENSIGGKILQKLDEVLDGDAFIWHHLEDIDSCLALKLIWPSTQANKLFLNSLNVDARNILFGQKWSSSVPLFAQTLSFSPLTPAKPTETIVTSANTWSIEDNDAISKKSTETSITWDERRASISKRKIGCEPIMKSDITSRVERDTKDNKDKDNEKVIPPAQFDWSSSGLTNPLDAPGLEKEILSTSHTSVLKNENDLKPTTFNMLDELMKGKELSKTTSLESLPLKVRNVLKDLPDLNYMKCNVLMFPIRGETDP